MKIQVKMTARDIFDFSMYSAYSGFAGIFTFVFLILVIGILGYAWSSVAVMQRVMLLGCIILFVFVQPIMIWMKAKAHAKTTGYSTPINLTFRMSRSGSNRPCDRRIEMGSDLESRSDPEHVYYQGRTDKRISCAIPVH